MGSVVMRIYLAAFTVGLVAAAIEQCGETASRDVPPDTVSAVAMSVVAHQLPDTARISDLELRMGVLELRAGARDDAIDFLLFSCQRGETW